MTMNDIEQAVRASHGSSWIRTHYFMHSAPRLRSLPSRPTPVRAPLSPPCKPHVSHTMFMRLLTALLQRSPAKGQPVIAHHSTLR